MNKKKPAPKVVVQNPAEGVRIIGILHLAGNILSGGILGTILAVAYYLIKKDTISKLEKETCFEVINFNLSFIIYTAVAGFLIILLIGIILLPIVIIVWLVLMIMGFITHLEGKNYRYPLIIRFLS
jgi:uncharacterized protein